MRLVLLLALTPVLVAGCATSEEIGRMQYDINTLKSQLKNIESRSSTIRTRVPPWKKQIDKKLKRIEETQKATAGTVSDLVIQLQSLTGEFRILTGRFEEARYFAEKSSAEFLKARESLEARLKELELAVEDLRKKLDLIEKEAKISGGPERPGETQKAKVSKGSETVRADAAQVKKIKDLYMEAYKDYKEGRMEEARKKFMSVINDYPESEYSDNARFWIGESYYKEGNYEDAILAYEELFRKNPDSNKYPDAMLKQGLAFYALKDKKTGRIILEKLIEKFPDSEQANLARKKIKKTVVPPKKK
ncbi:MAG: tol-pal system protein YbgF [Deferribacteres bacterium]|nr:tol-pal system protein YbgF [Deferribacteres bacterium]